MKSEYVAKYFAMEARKSYFQRKWQNVDQNHLKHSVADEIARCILGEELRAHTLFAYHN